MVIQTKVIAMEMMGNGHLLEFYIHLSIIFLTYLLWKISNTCESMEKSIMNYCVPFRPW